MANNVKDYEIFTREDGNVGFRRYNKEFNMWVEIFIPMEETKETIHNKNQLDNTIKNMYLSKLRSLA